MLFILNKNYEVVESLNNRGNMAVITPYFDDEYLQDLATGAETFKFSTLADSLQSQHLVVGNFIAFRYKKEYKLFNIINVEEEHTDLFIKNVYCEMASIELINDIVRPMKFSGTVRSFVNSILSETSWQLGKLDAGFTETFDLDLKDYKSVYTLLQEHIVNSFGAELSYRVVIENKKIVGKYVDIYLKRGRDKGLRFAYSKNLASIKRTIDTSNIATALIGIGNSNITFKEVDVPDKPAGQDFIANENAFKIWNVNGHHIMGTHKAETDSPQELLRLTRQALEERSVPQTKYEMKVELLGADVEIGDTVKIVDHEFNPPIHLEGRVNQLKISQTDPTLNECVLANFKEIGTNITAELKELAGYVDSKFPIDGSKDIIEGTIGDKQISKVYTSQVVADAVYASLVETEELVASKADIEDLRATNAVIENLKVKDSEIENAVIENANIVHAQVELLKAKDAVIENALIKKADIADLNATNATISNLIAKDSEIENAVIENANIVNGNINNLKANLAQVEVLVAEKATIVDLNATNAEIIKLKAMDAEINNAIIENADITFAEINQLKADVGEIDTLLAGNITSENIQAGSITSNELATGTITAGSTVIAEGAIGNAQISSIDAGKISAGKIDTSKVEVVGKDGHLRIKGNRLQVFNGVGNQAKERVSLGDVNGDGTIYGLRVRGADGQTILLDENGVTREGITDGAITNDKISDDANIDGAKLNINSVVSKINEDGTEVIKGTKIEVDGTSLTTKLSTITNKQTEHGEKITQHSSSIKANQDAIKLKVDSQTYQADKSDMTSKLEKNTSEISTMKGQIALKVEQADIENAKSEMEGMVDTKVNSAKAEIKVTTDAISQNVSNLSQTVSNKADGSTVTTLSNKVGSLETSVNGISGKVSNLETTTTTIGKKANDAMTLAETANETADENKSNISSLDGQVSTVKSQMATLDVNLQGITQRVSNTESTTSSLSTQLSGVSSTATNALNKANSANTLADSKAKVFTSQPTTPYKIGDLWVQGTSGDVMKCKTARSSGSYNSADWEKASKYTDDTKANAVDSKVTNLQTDYNKTKSQVAEIVTDLDGITQRVSNTESTTATISADLQSVSNVANSANSNASSALTTANNANKNATSAIDKANTAKSTADSALTQANTNKGNITSLQGTVNTTSSKVATLETNLNGITQRVSSTESTTATLTAKVNNVESTANTAKSTADSAKTTATGADTKATNAQNTANDAKTKAETATAEISKTNSKVASIETNLSGITSRVTNVENKTTTIEGKVNSHESRLTTAESKITDKAIINTVSSTIDQKVNTGIQGIQIGGRNLAQKTSSEFSAEYTNFSGITNVCPSLGKVLTDGLKVGDRVTVRLIYEYSNIVVETGQIAKCWIQGSGNVTAWNSGSFGGSSKLNLNGSGTHEFLYDFTINSNHLQNEYWSVNIRHDYVKSGSVKWKMFKVEKGTRATDWTPAPEDIDNQIANTETMLNGNIDSAVNGTKTEILNDVSKNYANKEIVTQLQETVDSKFEQTSKDITMQFNTAQNYTKEVDGKLQDYQNTVATHIRFSENGIDLGKSNSPFSATLDNTKLAFKQNNEEVAYISNNKMYITQAEIRETLRIGKQGNGFFAWVQGSEGNLSLKWSDS